MILEILIRLIIIGIVYFIVNEQTKDRDTNPRQKGFYFAAFPFYFFTLQSYQDYGESNLDFVMPIITNSIIFGFITFLIGYIVVKFKK